MPARDPGVDIVRRVLSLQGLQTPLKDFDAGTRLVSERSLCDLRDQPLAMDFVYLPDWDICFKSRSGGKICSLYPEINTARDLGMYSLQLQRAYEDPEIPSQNRLYSTLQ